MAPEGVFTIHSTILRSAAAALAAAAVLSAPAAAQTEGPRARPGAAPGSGPAATSAPSAAPRKGRPVVAWGVTWQPDLDRALALAARDHRTVVWFRVLGELQGLC